MIYIIKNIYIGSLYLDRISDIIIFVINLDVHDDLNKVINDDYINEFLKLKRKNALIYIVVKDIKKIINENIYKIRNKVKSLMMNNIINKYFEVNLWTGEGFEDFRKNLEIDSLLIKNKEDKKKDKNNLISIKYNKLNKYINY